MLKLILITNTPEIASYAFGAGAGRIMVDLETIGKVERQSKGNTLISSHSVSDIKKVRAAVPDCELIVRLNPVNAGTEKEANSAIDSGADLLMVPMFRTAEEVEKVCGIAGGRAGVMPLIETPQALVRAKEVASIKGVTELYVGLNDLHLGLGLDFMFEPLAGGLLDLMASIAKNSGKPFGFGGIARISEGLLPGEHVLAEHLRLGSSSVILSRTFHGFSSTIDELLSKVDLKAEIAKLRQAELELSKRNNVQKESDRVRIAELIKNIRQAQYLKAT